MSGTPERLDSWRLQKAVEADPGHPLVEFVSSLSEKLSVACAEVERLRAELLRAAPPPQQAEPVAWTDGDNVRGKPDGIRVWQVSGRPVFPSDVALFTRPPALDYDEPGATIVVIMCPECGSNLEVVNGDDEGEVGIITHKGPERPPALEPGQRMEGNMYESAEGIGFYETTQPPAAPGHRRATLIIHGATGEGERTND